MPAPNDRVARGHIAVRGERPEDCRMVAVGPMAGSFQVGLWIDTADHLPIANVRLTYHDAMALWEQLRGVLMGCHEEEGSRS